MKSEKIVDAMNDIRDEYIEEAHTPNKRKFVLSWELVGKCATALAAILLIIVIFPDFNHYSQSKDSYYYDEDYSYNAEVGEAKYEAGVPSNSNSGNIIETQNKKLILTASMRMESQNLDDTIETIKSNVNNYGGYMQSTSLNQNTSYSRTYSATIRIPADKYQEFLESINNSGNTVSYSEEVKDVTDSYTDLEARLTSYKAEEQKVLEFYDKAETLEELLIVEERLSEIRYEIEYLEAQIKNYDLLISYSTLNITVTETKTYTPVSQSFGSRLVSAFTNGLSGFISNVEDFIVDLVYNIWTIIFVVLLICLAVFLYKKFRNRKR